MKKYRPINGWTKHRIKEQLIAKNNGTRSYEKYMCVYETADGNHCAVGCFLPEGHEGLKFNGNVSYLLCKHPELRDVLPLGEEALTELQKVHDWDEEDPTDYMKANPQYQLPNVHERMLLWVEENVKD